MRIRVRVLELLVWLFCRHEVYDRTHKVNSVVKWILANHSHSLNLCARGSRMRWLLVAGILCVAPTNLQGSLPVPENGYLLYSYLFFLKWTHMSGWWNAHTVYQLLSSAVT